MLRIDSIHPLIKTTALPFPQFSNNSMMMMMLMINGQRQWISHQAPTLRIITIIYYHENVNLLQRKPELNRSRRLMTLIKIRGL